MKIHDVKVGQRVVYTPSHGKSEYGRVNSIGQKYVFVSYEDNPQSQATLPVFLEPAPEEETEDA